LKSNLENGLAIVEELKKSIHTKTSKTPNFNELEISGKT
jgi:hypothetical protein